MAQATIDRPARRTQRGDRAKPGAVGLGIKTPYLFLAPYLLIFTVFVLVPTIYALWVSLHEWDYLLETQPFVGLQNYLDLFTGGSATGAFFWQSMRATAIFTVLSVPFLVVLPLMVALVLNMRLRGRAFFRAVFFAPYVLGVAVVGILWRFLLDPAFGIVNFYLGKLGVEPIAWTNSTPWAWVALVGVTVWWTLGFNTVIFLAGLQEIPRELYEAARVDGAGRWSTFRYVTIPQLQPIFVLVTTITLLASANMFGQSFLITQGAPGEQTRTAIAYIAEESFRNTRMGNAAAMSMILALFLLVLGALNFAFFRRKED